MTSAPRAPGAPALGPPVGLPTPSSPQAARRRPSARRNPSTSSSLATDDPGPYPAGMPRPSLSRSGSGSAAVAALPREELHRLEVLINGYEAEEEAIMHRLARRLDELRRHEHAMSVQMEEETEGIVNRLQRQLRVVQGQLEAARRGGEGVERPSEVAAPLVPNVGLQAFLSGSDPVLMGNAVESLRAEKAEMGKRIDELSNENDALRQELIDLRRRLNIPVDDLVGLRARRPAASTATLNAVAASSYTTTGASQPISFNRQPHSTTHASSTASSSSTNASVAPFSASAADTGASSFPSPFSSQAESYLPRPPPNTRVSPGPALGFYGSVAAPGPPGRVYPAGQGGMPLTYPSVPPPSLSTSLASTSVLASPAGSPTHSRRPSMGRIAETGTFARGRVESFGVAGQRSRERPGIPDEAVEEAVED